MPKFSYISQPNLLKIANELSSGKLDVDGVTGSVNTGDNLKRFEAEFTTLTNAGMSAAQLALIFGLLHDERLGRQEAVDKIEWVMSGSLPETKFTRDTEALVRSMFSEAKESVLLLSYVVQMHDKAEHLFEPLAKNLDSSPNLEAKFCVDVKVRSDKGTSEAECAAEFRKQFSGCWPGERMPELFYFPGSFKKHTNGKASFHPKCLVVDNKKAFVTSANFTEAAQQRNVELGVVVTDAKRAVEITAEINAMIAKKVLLPVP